MPPIKCNYPECPHTCDTLEQAKNGGWEQDLIDDPQVRRVQREVFWCPEHVPTLLSDDEYGELGGYAETA